MVRGRCHQSSLPRLFFVPSPNPGGYPYRQDLILVPSNCECLVRLDNVNDDDEREAGNVTEPEITTTLWEYIFSLVLWCVTNNYCASSLILYNIFFYRLPIPEGSGSGISVGGTGSGLDSTLRDDGFFRHHQDSWFCLLFVSSSTSDEINCYTHLRTFLIAVNYFSHNRTI